MVKAIVVDNTSTDDTSVSMKASSRSGIEVTAHQTQRWVPKKHEARTFVVGNHITTVAIYAHSASGYIDWRTGYDSNTYELIEVYRPWAEHLQEGAMVRITRIAGLDVRHLDCGISLGPSEPFRVVEGFPRESSCTELFSIAR
ncbi:MAG: hypothetical protein ACRES5_21750, partial [Pseudomonas sp.]